jgi:hypothetical protein
MLYPDRRKIGSAAFQRDRKASRIGGKLGLLLAKGTGKPLSFSLRLATTIYVVFSGLLPHRKGR